MASVCRILRRCSSNEAFSLSHRKIPGSLEDMTNFVQARHYTPGRIKKVRLIVMHDMEAPNKPTTAEHVAAWFAGSSAPQASAHYCVDVDSVVQCVHHCDTAWGAPGANADGLQIELAGYASETAAQWTDQDGRRELALAAQIVASMCRTFGIPAVHLTPEQVKAGVAKGLCGHVDVTHAFATPGGHTDPGPNFPWATFLAMVKAELDPAPPSAVYVTVQAGDTLWSIGTHNHVSVATLTQLNHLTSTTIYPGQRLRVR